MTTAVTPHAHDLAPWTREGAESIGRRVQEGSRGLRERIAFGPALVVISAMTGILVGAFGVSWLLRSAILGLTAIALLDASVRTRRRRRVRTLWAAAAREHRDVRRAA